MNQEFEQRLRKSTTAAKRDEVMIAFKPEDMEIIILEIDSLRARIQQLEAERLGEADLEAHCPVCGADLSLEI